MTELYKMLKKKHLNILVESVVTFDDVIQVVDKN